MITVMYRCPECDSDDIQVSVEIWVALDQTDPENIETKETGGDHEWGMNSNMRCRDCSHYALAHQFEKALETA